MPMWYGSKATKAALAAEAERIAEVLAAAGELAGVWGGLPAQIASIAVANSEASG